MLDLCVVSIRQDVCVGILELERQRKGDRCGHLLNDNAILFSVSKQLLDNHHQYYPLVAGAWSERKKMFHGGSFLKLADDDMDIQNPEAQNRELSGF